MLSCNHVAVLSLKLLLIILAIIGGTIFVIRVVQTGGNLAVNIQVDNLSLCSNEKSGDTVPKLLQSTILSPTSAVYVCGYLKIERPAPGPRICLKFDIWKNGNFALGYPEMYCSQDSSGYFSYAVRSDEFLLPGNYRIMIYSRSTPTWSESINFEIR